MMERVAPSAIRFRVDPRDVPPVKIARLMSLTLADFREVLPRLERRGFPAADPDTGNYDLKAVQAWMDNRSGLTPAAATRDPDALMRQRIAELRRRG